MGKTIRSILEDITPPVILRRCRSIKDHFFNSQEPDEIREKCSETIPVAWSNTYHAYKEKFIKNAIDKEIMKISRHLPNDYGVGIDERCIEYPWLMANFPEQSEKVLDAGSALNHEYLLDQPVWQGKLLHILTLAPEGQAFWKKGISYLYSDLRDIPTRDSHYDVVVCLSTLEHIGFDNSLYTGRQDFHENPHEEFILVMQEIHRVLKPGGTLLLSVPFGKYQDYGIFQQFDDHLLGRAIEAFGNAKEVSRYFYKYTAKGWNSTTAEDCADSEYVEWIAKSWKRGRLPSSLPVEPDRAAAARAVACVKIVK